MLKLGKASLHRYPVGQKFCRKYILHYILIKCRFYKLQAYHVELNAKLGRPQASGNVQEK